MNRLVDPVLTLADLEMFDPRAPTHGAQRRFCCPLPPCVGKAKDAAHRSLVVDVGRGLWYCHRCGGKGRLGEYRQATGDARDRRRADSRAAFSGSRPPGRSGRPARPNPFGGERSATAASGGSPNGEGWQRWLKRAWPVAGTAGAAYLALRGLPESVATAADIWYTDDFFGRPAVLFPLQDRSGAVVAVSGRHTDGQTDPKAHSAGPIRQGLFLTQPELLDQGRIVLTEAPLDALSLAVVGQPAAALNGLHTPEWFADWATFREVVLAFDADLAGDRAATEIATVLRSRGARVWRWRPLVGKDWNDLLRTQGGERLHAALASLRRA